MTIANQTSRAIPIGIRPLLYRRVETRAVVYVVARLTGHKCPGLFAFAALLASLAGAGALFVARAPRAGGSKHGHVGAGHRRYSI